MAAPGEADDAPKISHQRGVNLEHATDEEIDRLEREFHRIRARARRAHGEDPAARRTE